MDQKQQPESQGEWVELHISCRGLKNLNTMYLSDPQVYVYEELGGNAQPVLIGQTEMVKHNLNPDFRTTIRCQYFFNRVQQLLINVYDANESVIGKLTQVALTGGKKASFMGNIRTTLSKLMGARDCFSKLQLTNDTSNQNQGQMLIYIDHVKENNQVVKLNWQWGGHDIKNVDWFSKSDPFAKFYRMDNQDKKFLIHQTEVIDNNLNPTWKPWETSVDQLCPQNDHFYVEVFDYNKVGGHTYIGAGEVSLCSIMEDNQKDFKLFDQKKKIVGHLKLISTTVNKPPKIQREISFLDYLRGGWQLSMVIGIDFTFSNGPIDKPDSLHKVSQNNSEMNQYQQTISQVGGIIISYDFDKEVPVYGFGGVPKLPGYTKPYAEDCFPINGNKDKPECKDVTGILEAYNNAVRQIEFAGPTFIGSILKNAKLQAQENATENVYTVILIMTDGQIEDMDDAMKLIAECSSLPISIIIVGISDENFSYMHKLDSLEEIRKHAPETLKPTVRNITQFVAYKEFKNNSEALCASVLDNFPKQFMEYMKINNKQPKEALRVQLSQINI